MKVLVTGSAGFIGSYLTERLLKQGCQVVGVDNFDDFYDPNIKRDNIKESIQNKNYKLIEADIRDPDAMEKAASKGIDAVIHLAARAGVRPSIEQPLLYNDVNINGTMVLLEATKKCNIKKFIFGSSSSVYGNNKKVPFCEDDNVDFPISPYAATKKACELICHTYHSLYNIDITCLRYFTVYGPRQRPDLAIHKFAKLIEQDKPIPVFGDGSMMRDFTYIDDIIDGTIAAMERCSGYNIYNLGKSEPIVLNNLIEYLEDALGKKAEKQHLPPQPGDVEKTFADIAKSKAALGYNPATNIKQGLEKFVNWLRKLSEQ
ncbi:MAG: GDP-mannose 4,6-dehydratase [Sedimentisphaerales bacterium]|nr:GDP-mannose 4,6-dehydratase [Sedimentisphaerales bacterium]